MTIHLLYFHVNRGKKLYRNVVVQFNDDQFNDDQ